MRARSSRRLGGHSRGLGRSLRDLTVRVTFHFTKFPGPVPTDPQRVTLRDLTVRVTFHFTKFPGPVPRYLVPGTGVRTRGSRVERAPPLPRGVVLHATVKVMFFTWRGAMEHRKYIKENLDSFYIFPVLHCSTPSKKHHFYRCVEHDPPGQGWSTLHPGPPGAYPGTR